MTDVLCTVVVPARDAAATLPDLLRGIDRQRPPFGHEILVVDNGSRDRTPQLARAAGARVIEERRPGAAAARNAGARAARGSLLVFLDADCAPHDGWLERLVASMVDAPAVGGVGGRVVAAPPHTLLERYAAHRGDVTQEPALADAFRPWLLTANCCYRRDVHERLGGFDEGLRSGEDVDFSWRMQLNLGLEVGYAPDAIVEHRHRTSLKGLWRQWVRYGWGTVQLADRYPEAAAVQPAPSSSGRWAVRWARALARGAAAGAVHRDALPAVVPPLDAYIRVAERAGRRQAARSRPS